MVKVNEALRPEAVPVISKAMTSEQFIQFLDRSNFDLNEFPEWERPYVLMCARGDDLSNWPPRQKRLPELGK